MRPSLLSCHVVACGALALTAAVSLLAFVLMFVASPMVLAAGVAAAVALTVISVTLCAAADRADRTGPGYAHIADRRVDLTPAVSLLPDRFDWAAFERQFAEHTGQGR